jgi:hypothetical protein
MSENELYRHEDIEALLMSKAFGELLSEEKAFVLQHVESEAEYNSLRSMLLEMHQLSFDAELKDPPESLETALLHGFAENADKVKGYSRRFAPWMGWAIAASVIGFCVIFFWPTPITIEKAEVEQKKDSPLNEKETPANENQKPAEPKPAMEVPTVTLPSDVEGMLAQVVPASTPAPPPYAEGLYEYEDALDAVSLTEEASEESQTAEDFAPVELDLNQAAATESVEEKDAAKSTAPAAGRVRAEESLAETTVKTVKITQETKALGKANRKKSRNPEVLKLSQSKKLKSLLRSE